MCEFYNIACTVYLIFRINVAVWALDFIHCLHLCIGGGMIGVDDSFHGSCGVS